MARNRISLGPSMKQQAAANERNIKRYEKAVAMWPWRDFLTDDERAEMAAADVAKAEWQRLNRGRASIQNRAIQRAKNAALRTTPPTGASNAE